MARTHGMLASSPARYCCRCLRTACCKDKEFEARSLFWFARSLTRSMQFNRRGWNGRGRERLVYYLSGLSGIRRRLQCRTDACNLMISYPQVADRVYRLPPNARMTPVSESTPWDLVCGSRQGCALVLSSGYAGDKSWKKLSGL